MPRRKREGLAAPDEYIICIASEMIINFCYFYRKVAGIVFLHGGDRHSKPCRMMTVLYKGTRPWTRTNRPSTTLD
jgi:hypothetical protein